MDNKLIKVLYSSNFTSWLAHDCNPLIDEITDIDSLKWDEIMKITIAKPNKKPFKYSNGEFM